MKTIKGAEWKSDVAREDSVLEPSRETILMRNLIFALESELAMLRKPDFMAEGWLKELRKRARNVGKAKKELEGLK